jgi:hypothetical protein
LYGLSSDTKPSNYATNTVWNEIDTGNIYTYNGSTWVLFRGASKTETYSNKNISYTNSNTILVDEKLQSARLSPDVGMWGAHCADGSSNYTPFGQLARFVLVGTVAANAGLISTEGLYDNIGTTTTINSKAGWVDNIAAFVVMDSNPDLKVRMRLSQTSAVRVLMGFNTTVGIPTTDTLNTAGTNTCAMWGFRTTDTNWQAVTCNGTTTTYTDLGQAATTTGFHTYEIKLTSGGTANFYYDGTLLAGVTTTTPPSGIGMHLVNFLTNSTSTNKTWDLKYDVYRADF